MASDPIEAALVTLADPPRDQRGCVAFLLDVAVNAGRVTDREGVLDALLDREATSPTGVGLGVAIPHAQHPGVTEPTVAFARSDEGVDFDAPDGEPATLLVLLLAPEDAEDAHLELLSAISRGLVDPDVRDRLATARDGDVVVDTLGEVIA